MNSGHSWLARCLSKRLSLSAKTSFLAARTSVSSVSAHSELAWKPHQHTEVSWPFLKSDRISSSTYIMIKYNTIPRGRIIGVIVNFYIRLAKLTSSKVSITDWSFFTLQNIVVSNDREAAAQLCGSILGYILAMTLMSTSNTILLGFVSPSLIDVDATERTLKVLENARLLALRCPWRAQSVPWSDKREIQFCNLIRNKSKFPDIPKGLCAIYQRELYHVRARVETTKLFALERRQWFTGFGLTEDLNSAGPILIHVCQNVQTHSASCGLMTPSWWLQALISHRLCVKLDQDKISFGSSSCEAAKTMNHGFVQLGNASMLPLHCEILRSNGGTLSLEVKKDALVSVNGCRVIDSTRKLNDMDLILLGQKSLFTLRVELACEGVG